MCFSPLAVGDRDCKLPSGRVCCYANRGMAGKKNGGDVVDLTVQILRDIRDKMDGLLGEQRVTNARLEKVEMAVVETNVRLEKVAEALGARIDATNARLERVERSLGAFQKATVKGLGEVKSRLDHLVEFTGERYRDHEERIRTLEERLLGQ